MESGFVYVLINPSLAGMVKIGRTSRSPEERAKELSQSTGTPTPFIVVYKTYFTDCVKAESYVHSILEEQGHRVSNNREFFSITTEEAINAVIAAGAADKNSTIESDLQINTENNEEDLAASFFDEAEHFFFGIDDYLLDEDEAYNWYQKALKLGVTDAYLRLGDICSNQSNNRFNKKRSINYYKKGASKNNPFCYIKLAEYYEQEESFSNLTKCLEKFMEIIGYKDWYSYCGNDERFEIGAGCVYCLEMAVKMDLDIAGSDVLYSWTDNMYSYIDSNIQYCTDNPGIPGLRGEWKRKRRMLEEWIDNFPVDEDDNCGDYKGIFEDNLEFIYWAVITTNCVFEEYDLFGDALELFDEVAANTDEYTNCIDANDEINAHLQTLMDSGMQELYQDGYRELIKWLPKVTKSIEILIEKEPQEFDSGNERHKTWHSAIVSYQNLSESMEGLDARATSFTLTAAILSFCAVVHNINKWQELEKEQGYLINGLSTNDLMHLVQISTSEILNIALCMHRLDLSLIIMSHSYDVDITPCLSVIRNELAELGNRSADISMVISDAAIRSLTALQSSILQSCVEE